MEAHNNAIAREMRMRMGESKKTKVVPVPEQERRGSGIYFENRELPIAKAQNCSYSRKRRRPIPPIGGIAMSPAPVLYNGFQDGQTTKRRCVSPSVATTSTCQLINHHKDPLRVIEDLRFTEAALTLTALCGRKHYPYPKIETTDAMKMKKLVPPRPVLMNRSLKGIKPDP